MNEDQNKRLATKKVEWTLFHPFYSGADYVGSRQVAGGRHAGGWNSRAYVARIGWQAGAWPL